MSYEGDIERLEAQKAKLQAKEDVRTSFKQRDIKRKQLKSEIRQLKYQKSYAFARGLGSGIKKGASKFAESQARNKAMQAKKFKGRRKSRFAPLPRRRVGMQPARARQFQPYQRGIGEIAVNDLI